jgi:hypothetical protein
MITWFKRIHTSVELILVEEKYMEVSMDRYEVIWLCKFLTYLFDQDLEPIVIYWDNLNCIKLSENLVCLDMSKKIDIMYPFI